MRFICDNEFLTLDLCLDIDSSVGGGRGCGGGGGVGCGGGGGGDDVHDCDAVEDILNFSLILREKFRSA